MQAILQLLRQAVDNIESVPEIYHQATLDMVNDCRSYLTEINRSIVDTSRDHLTEGLQKAETALDGFGKFLHTVSPVPDQQFVVLVIEATLRDHFLSLRSLSEIFQIAVEVWDENLEQLKKLRAKIDSGKSWRELYHAYSPSDIEKREPFPSINVK